MVDNVSAQDYIQQLTNEINGRQNIYIESYNSIIDVISEIVKYDKIDLKRIATDYNNIYIGLFVDPAQIGEFSKYVLEKIGNSPANNLPILTFIEDAGNKVMVFLIIPLANNVLLRLVNSIYVDGNDEEIDSRIGDIAKQFISLILSSDEASYNQSMSTLKIKMHDLYKAAMVKSQQYLMLVDQSLMWQNFIEAVGCEQCNIIMPAHVSTFCPQCGEKMKPTGETKE